MRNAFAEELVRVAEQVPQTVLLSGDIGNRLFDEFKKRFPKRFFNCGVAEANMMGMAAGMACGGLRPVVYTIVPFATTRCLEQIRVDVCYHRQPVLIVGVGGGLSYANLGATHHSCEDIAFMRLLPNMTVICPGDRCETRLALRAAVEHEGPVYLRLGKKGEPDVHQQPPKFEIGRAITVRPGEDVTFVVTGNLLPLATDAHQLLKQQGIAAGVVSMHTVKPIDEIVLSRVFANSTVVATVEEHAIAGGLGGTVAEWLAENGPTRARLLRVGTSDSFLHEAGDQSYARQHFDLRPESIARRIIRVRDEVLRAEG